MLSVLNLEFNRNKIKYSKNNCNKFKIYSWILFQLGLI